jgi:hypothetical protein
VVLSINGDAFLCLRSKDAPRTIGAIAVIESGMSGA